MPVCRNFFAFPNERRTVCKAQDCRFGKAISHLRIQTRGKVVIRHNEMGLPLWFTGDTNYWFEASPVTDVLVCENRFVGSRGCIRSCPEYKASAEAPYYHRGIRITDNVFDIVQAMHAINTDDIIFTGNRCSDIAQIPQIHAENCGRINNT